MNDCIPLYIMAEPKPDKHIRLSLTSQRMRIVVIQLDSWTQGLDSSDSRVHEER